MSDMLGGDAVRERFAGHPEAVEAVCGFDFQTEVGADPKIRKAAVEDCSGPDGGSYGVLAP